jgi:hypothetical protein
MIGMWSVNKGGEDLPSMWGAPCSRLRPPWNKNWKLYLSKQYSSWVDTVFLFSDVITCEHQIPASPVLEHSLTLTLVSIQSTSKPSALDWGCIIGFSCFETSSSFKQLLFEWLLFSPVLQTTMVWLYSLWWCKLI